MEILNHNHREIDIAGSLSASIKIIIPCTMGFPNTDIMKIWPPGFNSWGKITLFLALVGQFVSNFDTVFPKTLLYKDIVVRILK